MVEQQVVQKPKRDDWFISVAQIFPHDFIRLSVDDVQESDVPSGNHAGRDLWDVASNGNIYEIYFHPVFERWVVEGAVE